MSDKKKKEDLYYSQNETIAHNDKLLRFNGRQGHGYAAEQGNNLYDTINGRNAEILGDDNAKNGPDRMVDGQLIQTKYCQNANASVNSGFKNGKYRYLDSNGNPMQLEVPSDQYDEAIRIMEEKIRKGQVPGCKNPKDASKIIRKGNITLKQAINIAKAGTVESLVFDAVHGAVIGLSAAGISSTIVLARALWNGEDLDTALDIAMYSGIQAGGITFVTSVISSQITKTGVSNLLIEPSNELVKLLPSTVRKQLLAAIRDGAPIYGAAASKNLAKLLRGNFITQVVTVLVLSSNDIFHYAQGKISGKQLFKEVTTLVSGLIGGGVVGVLLAPLGPVGVIIGSIIGTGLSSEAMRRLLNQFIEDDAVKLIEIVNSRLTVLANEYLLSKCELDLVVEVLRGCLVYSKLLEMYASKDRIIFADELVEKCITSVIIWRTNILIPDQVSLTKSISRVLIKIENRSFSIDSIVKSNPQEIAKKILDRDISKVAAMKGIYVATQSNIIRNQKEMMLYKIQNRRKTFGTELEIINEELKKNEIDFSVELNKLKEQIHGI
ncbi:MULTISPECIES: hypothetical protein [unclassified Veillonella]|uniref:hypothetical protein n=1 Tax=unclassified Veillonella TaxID=2630086 RepID=UPI00044E5CAE|nr:MULTISPECIES: hypothetical protein [unclassified Veillonella]EUB27464.1 hypothetical protein HMPREF1504_0738 [Veillonella sp. ICM51a]MBS6649206.1 hypothetical protein [Veillonella sp.]